MADIALSQGVRQNLLAMQKTVDLMGRTQNRLATGKKVNSALDNPTSYFVSAGLENRANDLSRILDSMGLAVKTIEAADNGIKGIKRLIETAQGTARQALQAASSTGEVRSSKTLKPADTIPLETGDALTLNVGATTATFTIGSGPPAITTMQQLVDAINGTNTLNVSGSPPVIHATLDDTGKLMIENVTGGDLTVGLTDAGAANTLADLFGTGVGPTEVTSAVRTGTANTIRSSLATQFEGLKAQIDQLIKDTGYNGVNLLNGDNLRVLFNENNTTSITIEGVIFDSQGLGLAPQVDGVSGDSVNKWQSDWEIGQALTKLDKALNLVRSQASNFGSNLIVLQTRQDFTKQAIATLNGGSDLLTLADTSEEGANLLALQTRQQLSTQALSLSAQTDQAVLRLFG
jgi:flagellin-like hook-associated protein FlgL